MKEDISMDIREDEKKEKDRKIFDLMLIGSGIAIVAYAIGSAGKARYKADAYRYKAEAEAYREVIGNTIIF